MSQRMSRKRIDFAMIEAGGGHKMPALAVCEAMETLFPGRYELRVLDFMKDLGCDRMDAQHKKVWKYLLSHPNLTKGIQTFDFITGPVNLQIYKIYLERFYHYVLRYLQEEKPDLIFSTHYFNTMSVSAVRRDHPSEAILVNYLTEIFDFDSYWYLTNVDHYIVTSEQAQRKLLRKDFPPDKLRVFPYPVRHSFFQLSRRPEEVRGALGIDNPQPMMLVTLGSEGIGSVRRLLAALVEEDPPLNVVVVTGRNARLREELESGPRGREGRLKLIPLGYVDTMNELIAAADFCLIKPGPATTWEVLSLGKPIIFAESAQLSENPNIRYVLDHQLGFYAGTSPRRLVQLVRRFLTTDALERCRRAYQRLDLKNGSDDIACFLNGLLQEEPALAGPSGRTGRDA